MEKQSQSQSPPSARSACDEIAKRFRGTLWELSSSLTKKGQRRVHMKKQRWQVAIATVCRGWKITYFWLRLSHMWGWRSGSGGSFIMRYLQQHCFVNVHLERWCILAQLCKWSEVTHKHSWSPGYESCWLWWSSPVSSLVPPSGPSSHLFSELS